MPLKEEMKCFTSYVKIICKMKAILILGGIIILIPIVFLILIAGGWLVF